MSIANTNTFGVEIETVIPIDALRVAGWQVGAYHVGADIPNSDGWKAIHAMPNEEWGNVVDWITWAIFYGRDGRG